MDKIRKVMREYKEGTLRSGSAGGPKVKNRRQAIAIAMSEAGMAKKQKKTGKKTKGKNPFFGNKLPFVLGQQASWFKDSRGRGKAFC